MKPSCAMSLAALVLVAACGSDPQPPTGKVSVTSATVAPYAVELLTDTKLETGLTPIYLRITSGGQAVNDATVTFAPMMAMTGGTGHGAPVLAPPSLDNGGFYRCDVVFPMASATDGTWSATIGITRGGAAAVQVPLASLPVADTGRSASFSGGSNKYLLSLNLTQAPKVGLNPIVVTLHTKEGMDFMPVSDATFTLDPEMPSMGHGASGSVSPTATSITGRYEGKLSLSMAGTWEATVSASRGGAVVGSARFTIQF
jgi:hypothetical protein